MGRKAIGTLLLLATLSVFGVVITQLLWLQQARRTRGVVRRNLGWAALYNAASVPLAALGLMPPWLAGLGMAASSLLVVAHSARLAGPPAEAGSPAGLAAVPRIAH